MEDGRREQTLQPALPYLALLPLQGPHGTCYPPGAEVSLRMHDGSKEGSGTYLCLQHPPPLQHPCTLFLGTPHLKNLATQIKGELWAVEVRAKAGLDGFIHSSLPRGETEAREVKPAPHQQVIG